MGEPPVKPSKKECYALIQEVAVKRHPVCPWCPKPSVVGHHLFKRDRMATAFLPEAVQGMCDYHHGYWHKHPAGFRQEMIREIGDDRYWELERLSQTVVRNVDYGAVKRKLTLLLKGGGK